MARLLALTLTPFLLVHPAYGQKRREAILQLRDDVSTAMAHATLTEKQTQKLDHCRQTLLLAAQSGRMRKAATKRDLDGAVKDIEKAFTGGPFQADDRDVVREDIAQLRAIERNQQLKRASGF
jgi:Holliday junction resolvase RusA-like endonuclease